MPREPSARKAALAANKGKATKKIKLGGPLSRRSAEEQAEQRAIGARIAQSRADRAAPAPAPAPTPEPAERLPGARRETPCMGCLSSALSGRSTGACFDVAGAARAKRCLKCSSGHTCVPVPPQLRRAARELVSALENEADKKTVSAARRRVRELIDELKAGEEERAGSASPARSGSAELGASQEEQEEIEDEDEEEEDGERAARREQLKKELKTGFCALVDLLFE